MKAAFNVSDKVVVRPGYEAAWATVPPLVAGRVYCVERINCVHGNYWLRLVGIREHRRKCVDDRGVPDCCFFFAGRAEKNDDRKEHA